MRKEVIGDCTLYLGDCRDVLPTLPAGSVDAVITDPPYGIGADVAAYKSALGRIKANGKTKTGRGWKFYGETSWDIKRPDESIFELILSLDVPTVVWGGNYFTDFLPPSMGWVLWDKGQRNFSLADFEMAWTSERKASRVIEYSRAAALRDGKVHPTQKPIEVMKQCVAYLQRGRKKKLEAIVDPFMGSGTTGVACVNLDRKFIGCEINPEYFDTACKRIEKAYEQKMLPV